MFLLVTWFQSAGPQSYTSYTCSPGQDIPIFCGILKINECHVNSVMILVTYENQVFEVYSHLVTIRHGVKRVCE